MGDVPDTTTATGRPRFTLFTKPWPDLDLPELARFVRGLGFDGIELPVREGYQVEPANVQAGLRHAARVLGEEGLFIGSVAGPTDAATVDACGENGVGIIRVCEAVDLSIGYVESERRIRARYDALVPRLADAGVAIGVQNHHGTMIGSAIGIMHLIEAYDPAHVCAVLDPAHCAVDGEPVEMALDIVWTHLRLVNFKSASHRRTNRLTAPEAEWEVEWTTAQHAGYSWRAAAGSLRARDYRGDVCLPAEYSPPRGGGQLMGEAVVPHLRSDLAYLESLFDPQASAELGREE